MARIDHSNCSHNRTPAGRAACRKQNNDWLEAMGKSVPVDTPKPRRKLREAANAARGVQRDRERAKGRLERSGRPRKASCIQAALHTGRGKCACGWRSSDYESYV